MTHAELEARLAELLIGYQLLTARAVDRAREFQRGRGCTFAAALVDLHLIPDERLRSALEELTGVRAVDPSLVSVYPGFVDRLNELIPPQIVTGLMLFPVQMELNAIHVCMLNPTDGVTAPALEAICGCHVRPLVSVEPALRAAISQHYAAYGGADVRRDDDAVGVVGQAWNELLQRPLAEYSDAAVALINRSRDAILRDAGALETIIRDPIVIRFVQQVLARAVESRASDIHIEPGQGTLRIRLRVDGVMRLMCELPGAVATAVLARIKAMADLPIATAELPQDAGIGYEVILGRSVDLRMSLVPAIAGETIVLRVLERASARRTLVELGADDDTRRTIESATELPNGLLLVTGPTGSGKSSTLYALLDRLNSDEAAIITAEDPVESRLDGTTQVQCNAAALPFATALRSFLRQDPDVIMVGEIRDVETADVALKAALTGHLVLSTLHTNDASGAVLRLINMALEPFIIASALRLVIAQRLVRRLCSDCKRETQAATERLGAAGDANGLLLPPGMLACEPSGCISCGGTGYRGRIGIFEVLRVTEPIEELILSRSSASRIRQVARMGGMRTLRDAGLLLAADGTTTVEEVLRHTIAADYDPNADEVRNVVQA